MKICIQDKLGMSFISLNIDIYSMHFIISKNIFLNISQSNTALPLKKESKVTNSAIDIGSADIDS